MDGRDVGKQSIERHSTEDGQDEGADSGTNPQRQGDEYEHQAGHRDRGADSEPRVPGKSVLQNIERAESEMRTDGQRVTGRGDHRSHEEHAVAGR